MILSDFLRIIRNKSNSTGKKTVLRC